MLFTVSDLSSVYEKTYECLYRLREKAVQERLLYGESLLEREVDIIYDLMKAVEWASANSTIPDTDYDYQNLISYLRHKVEGFTFRSTNNGSAASFPTVVDTALPPTIVVGGSWRLFIQMVVGVSSGAPIDGANSYTNAQLIGKEIQVYLDGVELGTDLVDRQSYSFNPLTGTITWSAPLAYNQLIRVYVLVQEV